MAAALESFPGRARVRAAGQRRGGPQQAFRLSEPRGPGLQKEGSACRPGAGAEMKVNSVGEALGTWQIRHTCHCLWLCVLEHIHIKQHVNQTKLGLMTSGVFSVEWGCPDCGPRGQEERDSAVVQGSWLKEQR